MERLRRCRGTMTGMASSEDATGMQLTPDVLASEEAAATKKEEDEDSGRGSVGDEKSVGVSLLLPALLLLPLETRWGCDCCCSSCDTF